MDWGIVRDCIQKPKESVTDYRLRLTKIFRIHSGLMPPADPNVDSPYEQQEKNDTSGRHAGTCSKCRGSGDRGEEQIEN